MKQFSFGALLLALGALSASAGDDTPAPAPDADDTQDVLYVGKPHPVLMRLHLRVGGQSAFARWEACLEKFFRHLDRNRSGGLDRIEASKAPSVQQLTQFFQGNAYVPFNPRARAGTALVDFNELDRDRDGKVTLDEFVDYYRRAGAGPVQLQVAFASNSGSDGLTDVVFNLLDVNKDGKLSRAELEAAEKVLMKYDTDDNELVSQQEVGLAGARGNRQGLLRARLLLARQGRASTATTNLMLVSRDEGKRATGKLRIARDVLARYDTNKDGKLSREEIAFPQKLFDALDRNRDGKLDVLELVRWVKAKPAGEFALRLGGNGAMMRRPARRKPAGQSRDMIVNLDGVRINVLPLLQSGNRARVNYLFLENQFDQIDKDKKGFLTRKQVEDRQYTYLRGLFELADRDNDGQVTRQELKDYLALITTCQGTQIRLAIASTGQGLFQTLDTNNDGQLSVRELRNAWTRLAAFDRDGDGCISRTEFPHQFQLTVAQSSNGSYRASATVAVRGAGGRPGVRGTARGPLWFLKMDRNGDGDVSRTEWLGTPKQFDEIDSDRDGLISVEEAETYDDRVRKKERP